MVPLYLQSAQRVSQYLGKLAVVALLLKMLLLCLMSLVNKKPCMLLVDFACDQVYHVQKGQAM